jgi:hypothetical protein
MESKQWEHVNKEFQENYVCDSRKISLPNFETLPPTFFLSLNEMFVTVVAGVAYAAVFAANRKFKPLWLSFGIFGF